MPCLTDMSQENPPISGQALRLVLADADESVRPICAMGLRELGWEVAEVASGSMLESIVQRVVPDVIVLDASIQEQDPNATGRIIVQGAGHGRIPVLLTCDASSDKMAIRQLVVMGVRAILVKPVLHSTLVGKISELVPWAIQSPAMQNAPACLSPDDQANGDDSPVSASSRVASNHSLLSAQVFCPFHEQVIPFAGFSLRSGRVEVTQNLFDLPVYLKAIGQSHYCNYHLVQVTVCPQCLFASNSPDLFLRPVDRQRQRGPAMREKILQVVQADSQRRRRLAQELSPTFFSEQRTLEQALLSLNLALDSSHSLLQADSSRFINELARMGNYHLRLAHLKEHRHLGLGLVSATDHVGPDLTPEIAEHYTAAHIFFRKAAQYVQGSLLCKTLYQLTATSVFLSDDETAKQAVDRLSQLSSGGVSASEDRSVILRYVSRAKKVLGQREQHRMIPPAGSSSPSAA